MGQHPVLIGVENIVALLGRELVVREPGGDQGQARRGGAPMTGKTRVPGRRGLRGEAADVEGEGFAGEGAEGLRLAFHLHKTIILSESISCVYILYCLAAGRILFGQL